tara:strand:+ start:74 stop:580 length:507 start_codon:yes stop_codon:yes gene_type:complete
VFFFALGVFITQFAHVYRNSPLFRYCIKNPGLIPKIFKTQMNISGNQQRIENLMVVLKPIFEDDEIREEMEKYFHFPKKEQKEGQKEDEQKEEEKDEQETKSQKRKEINRNKINNNNIYPRGTLPQDELKNVMKNQNFIKMMSNPDVMNLMQNKDFMNMMQDIMKKQY